MCFIVNNNIHYTPILSPDNSSAARARSFTPLSSIPGTIPETEPLTVCMIYVERPNIECIDDVDLSDRNKKGCTWDAEGCIVYPFEFILWPKSEAISCVMFVCLFFLPRSCLSTCIPASCTWIYYCNGRKICSRPSDKPSKLTEQQHQTEREKMYYGSQCVCDIEYRVPGKWPLHSSNTSVIVYSSAKMLNIVFFNHKTWHIPFRNRGNFLIVIICIYLFQEESINHVDGHLIGLSIFRGSFRLDLIVSFRYG